MLLLLFFFSFRYVDNLYNVFFHNTVSGPDRLVYTSNYFNFTLRYFMTYNQYVFVHTAV